MNEIQINKDKTELIELMKSQSGSFDFKLVEKAYDRCVSAHDGQLRASGEPFSMHPIAVASIIIKLGMDSESIAAALLHDVVEDTEVTKDDIEKEFGTDVAELVDGVTKLGKIPYTSREQLQAENIRKMFIAMAHDVRVIIIKLADRLHNMRTLDYLPQQKQRDKSLETLEIFAPIAHRLGIRAVKEELEDLSIKHLDPVAYHEIETLLSSQREFREKFLKDIQVKITDRVSKFMGEVHIEGRIKSIHGIYRKMYIQGRAFEEIYDIYAVRLITDTVNNCYNILGLMHDMFRPIPNRFKDYISTPKPNMYQSLHTTVIGREGVPFEIQIRTWDMHHTAEYGIAAHWKYKEGINKNDAKMEERLAWIRQILENQKEAEAADDIVQTIKTDLNQEDVFAVTPKGDVINLPVGSTVIDFAYAIHTAVGNKMVGAKVDGRIVPLTHEVKTGEIIEILTSSATGRGPSRDWLTLAKTSQAKNKIRTWFKKECKEENITEGKQAIEREFARNNIRLSDEEYNSFLSDIASRQQLKSIEGLYEAIGYGGIVLSKIMPRVREYYLKLQKSKVPVDINDILKPRKTVSPEGVIVEGVDNCLINLSKCCAPLPGDPIIGFITRGHGVSIHKRDCNNVPKTIENSNEPERWIKAYWTEKHTDSFKSALQIQAIDRDGILADITVALVNMHVPMQSVNARVLKSGNCEINVTITIESLEHLRTVIIKIEKIQGVLMVTRMNQ